MSRKQFAVVLLTVAVCSLLGGARGYGVIAVNMASEGERNNTDMAVL